MSKINKYRMMELGSKVAALSEKDGLKLVYQWVKQDVVNFGEFRELLDYVNYERLDDFDLSE